MMPSRVDEYETLLTETASGSAAPRASGTFPARSIALSMSGPTIRAAGVPYDNRKMFPYSSYEEFDFSVPTRTESDC